MKNRTPTTLEYALLGLIHAEPRTGYDLCKVFETTPMAHYSSSPGAIYPALKRLEQGEFISGKVERGSKMRPRKKYSLAPRGLKALEHWVSSGIGREDLVWHENELMLRFSFMGQFATEDMVRRFLANLAGVTEEYILELEGHYEMMAGLELPSGTSPTGRMALRQGIGSYRELARWARASLEELDSS
jgi:DNA-binding PadR family transcriptional regulator